MFLCSKWVMVAETEVGTGEMEEHPEMGPSNTTPAVLVMSIEHQLCNEGAWTVALGHSLNHLNCKSSSNIAKAHNEADMRNIKELE